jgi:hypothetical protein
LERLASGEEIDLLFCHRVGTLEQREQAGGPFAPARPGSGRRS